MVVGDTEGQALPARVIRCLLGVWWLDGVVSVTEAAILSIKQMIISGELRPGDRMPPEAELGERLGLSRSSLREAIKALEMVNVLDVRRGDGTYVTSLDPSVLSGAVGFVVELQQGRTALELLEVRRILETAAARRAAVRVDAATLDLIEAEVGTVEDADTDLLVRHDAQFHRLIAQAADNAYLVGLLDALSPRTLRVRAWRALTERGAAERTVSEHRAILAALRAGDPDLASAWMTVHIQGVEEFLRQSLDVIEESG